MYQCQSKFDRNKFIVATTMDRDKIEKKYYLFCITTSEGENVFATSLFLSELGTVRKIVGSSNFNVFYCEDITYGYLKYCETPFENENLAIEYYRQKKDKINWQIV